MKKNIEVISAEEPLLQWTLENLKKAPGRPEGAEDLIRGISSLFESDNSTLMIEKGNSSEYLTDSRKICSGSLCIDASARQVTRDGKEIALTPKEFDILYFLAKNRGEVYTKEQIYQAVWDNEYLLDDSNIMAFIRKIRKKIEPNPDAPQYILTIWGIGYKFTDQL